MSWDVFSGVAGAVTGLGGIVSSLTQRSNQKAEIRQQSNANEDAIRLQYDLEKKLIDKENEYNTPKKQMERLSAAGLNPNLMYGAISSGNQSSAGSVSAPSAVNVPIRQNIFGALLSSIGEIAGSVADIQRKQDNIEEDRKITNKKVDLLESQNSIMNDIRKEQVQIQKDNAEIRKSSLGYILGRGVRNTIDWFSSKIGKSETKDTLTKGL